MEDNSLKAQIPASPQTEELKEEGKLLHQFEGKPKNWMKIFGIASGVLLIIAGGVLTGNVLVGKKGLPGGKTGKGAVVKTEKSVGSTDTKTFRDSTEGTLESGGLDGEGTHHLVRPGGESQTAYLTSSIIDLDQYVGKKVKIWGETFSAQKAGWLMDVGKIELLE